MLYAIPVQQEPSLQYLGLPCALHVPLARFLLVKQFLVVTCVLLATIQVHSDNRLAVSVVLPFSLVRVELRFVRVVFPVLTLM